MNDSDNAKSLKPGKETFHISKRLDEKQEIVKDEEIDDFFFPRSLDDDVNLWSTEDVIRFIRLSGQSEIAGAFNIFLFLLNCLLKIRFNHRQVTLNLD